MPCGNVWVNSFDPNVPSQFEYVCWPDSGGDDVDRAPSPGPGAGVDTGIAPPSLGFDPAPSGSGTVVVAGGETTAEAVEDLNPGWNAGAYSLQSVAPDWRGAITFDVPDVRDARPGGVAVGLAPVSSLPGSMRNGYGHLDYGLVFTATIVKVIHGGEIAATFPYSTVLAARTAAGTDTVAALMYGDFVKWVVNDLTLFAGAFSMPGPYALDSTFYTAYDAVDNPAFVAGDWGALEDGSLNGTLPGLSMAADASMATGLDFALPGLSMRLSDTVVWDLTATLPAFRFEAGQGEGVEGRIGPIAMVSSESATYGAMVARLGSLSLQIGMGEPDASVTYSVLSAKLPPLAMTATVPPIATFSMQLPGLSMRASSETSYSELVAAMPGLRMKAYSGEMTPLVQVMEYVGFRTPQYPSAYIALALIERVGGGTTAEVFATVTADGSETLTFQDSMDLFTTAFHSVVEQLAAGDRLTTAVFRVSDGKLMDEGQAWVVNTDTSASTRYDSYGFNSFACVGGQYFGARQDGVFRLTGATDAGAAIVSGVALGMHDFGTQNLKGLNAVYAGVSSTGALFIKVGDGVNSYTYRARRTDTHQKVQRFDTGRGLRASYFTFDLTSEADAFELDSVTFNVLPTSRRI